MSMGRDLDYKIQEYKEAGKLFPENQIIEWFIQLLLGVDYMHERDETDLKIEVSKYDCGRRCPTADLKVEKQREVVSGVTGDSCFLLVLTS
ncbi:hypothetical protein P7K49_031567 [Saguinus oedipus]|uniref:non-specific serine/threonine protein kinase n=1 Tax=Saguinus oedipus TaxID=9490 RepID=A0ABQ9TZV8_SAGOE|nr:hypothetical protein P7K49_031567 [Saguinus oedipus]